MITYMNSIGGDCRALVATQVTMLASTVPARLRVQTAPGVFGGTIVGVKDASLGRTGGQLT